MKTFSKALLLAIKQISLKRPGMTVISKLATSLNRRDEVPNQELAEKIVAANDKKAIKELVELLKGKNKDIQNDCIKVMYEIGAVKPTLVVEFNKELLALLDNKNNRLQWGAMMVLDYITNESPAAIYAALPKIIDAADKGSVITNDHCVGILIKLCAIKKYAANAFALLNERLKKSPANQLAMYAEKALPIINDTNKTTFIKTLTARLADVEKDTKRIRIEKVIKKLTD
jgi:hypothetical protein